jgi:capsular exopolysaccharide synthesis family protein
LISTFCFPNFSFFRPLVLLNVNDDRHLYAESYRNLRSALLYLGVEGRRPKVVLITSAVPNEGKSTIATNLARVLALGGSKVLLVDGDLRKGHIHEALNLQPKPGLSDLLRQPDDPGKFVQATDLPNFHFLSRGGITRNPGDLFLSPAVDQILGRLRDQYDYVLIDSSPVFAADDTSTLAPKADGTLVCGAQPFLPCPGGSRSAGTALPAPGQCAGVDFEPFGCFRPFLLFLQVCRVLFIGQCIGGGKSFLKRCFKPALKQGRHGGRTGFGREK